MKLNKESSGFPDGGKGEAVADGWKSVPPVMTAAMINAWSNGITVTSDNVAARTSFQDAWKRLLNAAPQAECAPRALDSGAILKKAEMHGLPLNQNTFEFARAIELAVNKGERQ